MPSQPRSSSRAQPRRANALTAANESLGTSRAPPLHCTHPLRQGVSKNSPATVRQRSVAYGSAQSKSPPNVDKRSRTVTQKLEIVFDLMFGARNPSYKGRHKRIFAQLNSVELCKLALR